MVRPFRRDSHNPGDDADIFAFGDDQYFVFADAGVESAAPLEQPEPNGSGTGTTAVTASGDQRIDGLLSGVRWNGGFITYSDPDNANDYQAGYTSDQDGDGISAQNEGFSQLSAQQLRAVHFGLNQSIYSQPSGASGLSVEGFTNLGIDYGVSGSGAATLRVANTSDAPTSYAFYPSASIYGGDAWFGPSARTPTAGNYSWHTTLHELGHSLGLAHGHTGGFNGALPSNVDSMEYTVMTYRSYVGGPSNGYTNEQFGYAQTYMMLDIQALQYMYGADFTSNSGNTVYAWNPTTGQSYVNGSLAIDPGGNRIFETIWDGGGNDTYDMSNYSNAATIDLRPGSSSLTSTVQLAYLGNAHYASGNVYNALQYQNDARSLIENAIGGSGNDTLIGNQGNNTLDGNAGADRMIGGLGNDNYGVDNPNDVVSENSGEGFDAIYASVDYAMPANIENLVLVGNAILGVGNDLGTYIGGNNLNNVIDGRGGADLMVGGLGNDTYFVESTGDRVSENAGEGTDLVYASLNWTLSDNVEYLVLTGAATLGIGNSLDNYIAGTAGNNVIDGRAGADNMVGYAGNDVYIVDNEYDNIVEAASEGADSVYSAINYSLRTNVENLTLTGSAVLGVGNDDANTLIGNDGNNVFDGRAGNDVINGAGGNDLILGGLGSDYLLGGAGADTFQFNISENVSGIFDVIDDFEDGLDGVLLNGWNPATTLLLQNGSDVVITTLESSYNAGVIVTHTSLAQINDQYHFA